MTSFNAEAVDDMARELVARLGAGREHTIKGSDLARELGVSERMVRVLVEYAIADGYVVGSICSGERPGYFLCTTADEVEAGCGHLVSRARSLYARVSALRTAAAVAFEGAPEVLRLFDLDEAQNGSSAHIEPSRESSTPQGVGA